MEDVSITKTEKLNAREWIQLEKDGKIWKAIIKDKEKIPIPNQSIWRSLPTRRMKKL